MRTRIRRAREKTKESKQKSISSICNVPACVCVCVSVVVFTVGRAVPRDTLLTQARAPINKQMSVLGVIDLSRLCPHHRPHCFTLTPSLGPFTNILTIFYFQILLGGKTNLEKIFKLKRKIRTEQSTHTHTHPNNGGDKPKELCGLAQHTHRFVTVFCKFS